jgi:AcrR family transcriptional regulator
MRMTQADIIQAAFRVWGRELYQTTSLTQIARDLKVTKPAVYRHFRNKQALLDAMYGYFFDEYTAFIKAGYDRALAADNPRECLLIMARSIVRYYCQNMGTFVFSLVKVYGNREVGDTARQLASRGVDMQKLAPRWEAVTGNCIHAGANAGFYDLATGGTYPNILQLVIVTLTFRVAHFHKDLLCRGEAPTADTVDQVAAWVEAKISRGLGFDRAVVETIDFEGLEKRLPPESLKNFEDDGLYRAVAGVVAEAGPWNASMDMIARRSGMTKSGLYSHFESKHDMLRQFFLTEIERLLAYVEEAKKQTAAPEEQLYLIIISTADYLRSRPDILTAIDWLRTRRLDPGIAPPQRFYDVFTGCIPGMEEVDTQDRVPQWIQFLIVNTLMRGRFGEPHGGCLAGGDFSTVTSGSFRILYRFITLGMKGFEK